ncbi:S49 family peptidase [Paracoccus sanguinis]|uniref:Peptidase S49 domain-containing protein n=1 Tax=Paracoccus sanguinis TaxID=1545044 RepID=A0A099GMJ5_9RHOB|nr:S49 family peptidase [Paracoccus sanguinis]KGJ23767.1 hypothetical protein IX56_00385 [Paracoccus sanguinis]
MSDQARISDQKIKIRAGGAPDGAMLAVASEHLEWFSSAFGREISASEMAAYGREYPETGDPFWDRMSYARPYDVVRRGDDGVLVIPVYGALLDKFPLQMGEYATGYEYITRAVQRATKDAGVRAIVLDIDSPGGVVPGCAECAAAIAEAAQTKPVFAYAADTAASAAYWLASQATQVHVNSTGEVGSIGVIWAHRDTSERLRAEGVKITPIFGGERKPDGQPYLPLEAEAKAHFQKRVNAVYAEFISAVARGREMNGDDIRNTQAAVFPAREAVRIGLADAVSTRAQVMDLAFGEPARTEATRDKAAMTDTNTKTAQATAEAQTQAQAAAPATAEQPAMDTAAIAAQATAAAMARVQAILGADEAQGREAQAKVLAFSTDLTADQAKAVLAAAPVAAAPAPAPATNAFAAAMSATANPEVGAGAGNDTEDDGVLAAVLAGFGKTNQ